MTEAGRLEMSGAVAALGGSNASRLQLSTGMVDPIDDIRSSLHSVADLTSLISTSSASDYSYFNFEQLKLHTLPKHLKLIASRLAAYQNRAVGSGALGAGGQGIVALDGAPENQVKARQKKEAPRLEFKENDDLAKYFRVTKKMTYLCDRTLEKRSEKPMFMESERQTTFDSKEFFQPFWKKIKVKKKFHWV